MKELNDKQRHAIIKKLIKTFNKSFCVKCNNENIYVVDFCPSKEPVVSLQCHSCRDITTMSKENLVFFKIKIP